MCIVNLQSSIINLFYCLTKMFYRYSIIIFGAKVKRLFITSK